MARWPPRSTLAATLHWCSAVAIVLTVGGLGRWSMAGSSSPIQPLGLALLEGGLAVEGVPAVGPDRRGVFHQTWIS